LSHITTWLSSCNNIQCERKKRDLHKVLTLDLLLYSATIKQNSCFVFQLNTLVRSVPTYTSS
jgi:hypothetical protein